MNWKKVKKKSKKEKLPEVRKLSRSFTTRIVSVGFILLFMLAFIGVVRSNIIASNMSKMFEKIDALEKQEQPPEKQEIKMAELSYYTNNFVKEYMNLDSEKKESGNNTRYDRLEKFLSFDGTQLNENIPKKYKRELQEAAIVDVEETNDSLLVTIEVLYKETLDKKITEKHELMMVPIVEENSLYAVVSPPYFLAVKLPQGKTKALQAVEKSLDVDSKEKNKMEKFLKLFFTKYAEGDKTELSLLMKEPILTTGMDRFKEIEKGSLSYFETNENDLQGVQISVIFENKVSKMTRTEYFTLWIGEAENTPFVYTLKNYFTESRE